MKIYCASDFHLGYEQTNYKKIIEFLKLAEEDADKLILCGDILDLWRCPLDKIQTERKRKGAYNALCSLAESMDITYIWGNHDYKIAKVWKEAKDLFKITDEFNSDNIYYSHGWRFDLEQRVGYWFYGWLINQFPYLYQKFFKTPFEAKKKEEKHSAMSLLIHAEAKRHIKKKKVKYLIMGHTHDPIKDGILFDCGDMVDSLSYLVIENGKPRLEKMSRK